MSRVQTPHVKGFCRYMSSFIKWGYSSILPTVRRGMWLVWPCADRPQGYPNTFQYLFIRSDAPTCVHDHGMASIHSFGPCAPGRLILREALRSASVARLRARGKTEFQEHGLWRYQKPRMVPTANHVIFYTNTRSGTETTVLKSNSNLVIQKSF